MSCGEFFGYQAMADHAAEMRKLETRYEKSLQDIKLSLKEKLIFGSLGFFGTLLVGIDIGFADIWNFLEPYRELCLIIGIILSFSIAALAMFKTLEREKRTSLEWLGLPIIVLCWIELFLHVPSWRPWLLIWVVTKSFVIPCLMLNDRKWKAIEHAQKQEAIEKSLDKSFKEEE